MLKYRYFIINIDYGGNDSGNVGMSTLFNF